MARGIRGQVCVAGIGETTYYKHGQSPDPEFKLALMAILAAAKDAGSTRRTLTASAPTPTTATSPHGWRRRWARRT